MSHYRQLSSTLIERLGASALNGTMCRVELEVHVDGSVETQEVYVRGEVLPPDLEFIHVDVPIGRLHEVDLRQFVPHVGPKVVGSVGYVPFDDHDGLVTFTAKVPSAALSAEEPPMAILLWLHLLASTGWQIRRQLSLV